MAEEVVSNWVLDLAGVQGSSGVTGYEKKINLVSFSLSVIASTNRPGAPTGKPIFSPASFTMAGDSGGPKLVQGIIKGNRIATAIVTGLTTLDGPQKFAQFTFTGIYLTQVTPSMGAPGKLNVNQFHLYFETIKFEFWKKVGKSLVAVEPVPYTIAKQKLE